MNNALSERPAHRMQADQEELSDRIARALPHDGAVESQPDLHFRREYKRHFGHPPVRDVDRLRELAGTSAAQ